MSRWLIAIILCGTLWTGCKPSRIERKPLVASDDRRPQSRADRDAMEPSPPDKMAVPGTSPVSTPAAETPAEPTMPQAPAAARPQTDGRPAAAVKDGEITVERIRLSVPRTWVERPPQSGFLLAEFALPRAEGDPADGRLTVSQAGGSVANNIERWRQQFGGKPEKQSQEKIEAHGIPVTLVDFSGAYLDQRGPFAPAVESPGYRMLGAIADVEGQLYFLKAYGPAKTMAARAGEFREFVGSLKPAGKR